MQRTSAELLGISDKTGSKWERDNGMPKLSLMPSLCAAFVFNWSHPVYKCTSFEDGKLVFCNTYYDERCCVAEIGGCEDYAVESYAEYVSQHFDWRWFHTQKDS